jgi:hypothetical protein
MASLRLPVKKQPYYVRDAIAARFNINSYATGAFRQAGAPILPGINKVPAARNIAVVTPADRPDCLMITRLPPGAEMFQRGFVAYLSSIFIPPCHNGLIKQPGFLRPRCGIRIAELYSSANYLCAMTCGRPINA